MEDVTRPRVGAVLAARAKAEQAPAIVDEESARSVVIDLNEGRLRIGEHSLAFDSPVVDQVLDRYVHLVRHVRSNPQTLVDLRGADVSELAIGLGRSEQEIRQRLEQLLETLQDPDRQRWLARLTRQLHRTVPPALLIALTWLAFSNLRGGDVENAVATPESQTTVSLLARRVTPPVEVAPSLTEDPRVGAIEARIGWDFRGALPEWTIIHAGEHPLWRGVTNSKSKTVTLYDRNEASVADAAAIFAHELGHALDLSELTNAEREAWMASRGIETAWWAGEGLADFAVGAGDFAEAVAVVVAGGTSNSEYGSFSEDQLAFVRSVIDRASR